MKLSTEQKIEIKKKIAELFGYVVYDELIENDSMGLVRDLGCDDLDLVEIVMEMEKMFDIAIPDDDWEKVVTIEDIYSCIEKHTAHLSDKNDLLRENIQSYLDSKITGGGLYGLTIDDDGFLDGLIETIKLSDKGEKFEKTKEDDFDGFSFGGFVELEDPK